MIAVRDSANAVIGGLWGSTGYGWLYTQMLLVPEALRGQGLGRAIPNLLEKITGPLAARCCDKPFP